ncbi:MAG: SDR family oxidoreductase [Reyranella sp.]|nr:SDR family oxidoreductase [Reyranella sp.]
MKSTVLKSVVITGVSTGIGHGTAAELCRRGYKVFGSVRTAEQAARLQREFGSTFTPLVFDVTDADAIGRAAATVKAEIGDGGLFGLVNNAGISDPGPLTALSPDVLRRHFEVNVVGVLHMVQAFLPLLRAAKSHPPGRIVNISSVSGRIAYPFMGPYAASKHALEALSDSLRRELLIYGVDVIVIQPGAIDTPIWDKAAHLKTTFDGTDYHPVLKGMNPAGERRTALPVAAVTRRIIDALVLRRPKTRYVVPDRWVRYWLLPRWLPDRWLDRAIDRLLKFQKVRDDIDRP